MLRRIRRFIHVTRTFISSERAGRTCGARVTACEPSVIRHTQVHFEQRGSELIAVEIDQNACFPVVGSLHRALFALGVTICSYEARRGRAGLFERIVLERHDGKRIEGAFSDRAKATILPIALQSSGGELG